jgi:hypothetical protein
MENLHLAKPENEAPKPAPEMAAQIEAPKLEAKVELPQPAPVEPEKLTVSADAGKEAPPPAPVEATKDLPPPEAKAVEVPPPAESKPLPLDHGSSHKTNADQKPSNILPMETKPKPTFDEAARGVARIIFGDDNITDMNVRLTRIALERYNVPTTQSMDEVARGVTQIIFGDGGVSDMNVRLTRIALDSYNVTELLGLNGAKKAPEAPQLVSL